MQHLPIHPRLRHPLTGEPLRAVGFSRRGPIWPILGAAEGGEGGSGEGSSSGEGSAGDGAAGAGEGEGGKPGEGSGELGEGGKRALQEERDSRKAAERRAKAAEAELEKHRKASQSDQEKALDTARKEGESAADERWKTRTVSAEVRAAAAALKFHDPRDAVVQLHGQLGDITVDDDGEVDGKAIEKLLADLKERKPYLVDEGKQTTAPARDAGLGAAGNGSSAANVQPGIGRLRHAYETSGKK